MLTPATPPQPLPPVSAAGLLNVSDFLALVQGELSALSRPATASPGPTTTASATFAAGIWTASANTSTATDSGWKMPGSYNNVTLQVLSIHSNLMHAMALGF